MEIRWLGWLVAFPQFLAVWGLGVGSEPVWTGELVPEVPPGAAVAAMRGSIAKREYRGILRDGRRLRAALPDRKANGLSTVCSAQFL